mmetsp:Transcript_60211/g.71624  ORF Transcript_60211/g.71624 Transcript_60211/m.71624 type:complete len:99 (+) Transcript_60211:137-433(+)
MTTVTSYAWRLQSRTGREEKKENDEPLNIVARMRQGREQGEGTVARPVLALLLTGETVYITSLGCGFCEWEMTKEEGEASVDSSSSDKMRTALRFARE